MTIKERYKGILEYFQQEQPNPETELQHGDPYELLVAVMLSAQCTDKRINMVTPALFNAYPTPQAMAAASVEDILHNVKSVSYPNSKAAHLQAMAQKLVEEFNGQVPDNMKDLTSLPGVGRKTANVILGIVFGKATIPVDTHVYRVSHRLGLSQGKTPDDVERDLSRNIPADLRFKAHHWILLHGRYVCKSQRPDCLNCGIEINAQPPGKKLQNMMQLSGGEKALTAIAILFAIQNLKPSPFCILDEIEAALDDSNIIRYAGYLRRLSSNVQFIVITHRKGTMEAADRLYGITMQERGVSTLISVDLTDIEEHDEAVS